MTLNIPTVPQPYVPQEFPKWITVAGKQVLVNSREEELQHLPQTASVDTAAEIIEVPLPTPPVVQAKAEVKVAVPPAPEPVKAAVKAPAKPVPAPLPVKAQPKLKPKAGKRK